MLMKKLLTSLGFFMAALIILLLNTTTTKYDLKVGSVSNVVINSPRDIIDEYDTDIKKEQVKKQVLDQNKIYNYDSSVLDKGLNSINDFYNLVANIRNNKKAKPADKIKLFYSQNIVQLTKYEYELCLNSTDSEMKNLHNYCNKVYANIMSSRIEENQIGAATIKIKEEFQTALMNEDYKKLGTDIVSYLIKPNTFYDEKATLESVRIALEKVEPVMVKEGQKIVDEGAVVTEREIRILKSLNLIKDSGKLNFGHYTAIFFILLSIYIAGFLYIYTFNPDVLKSHKTLIMLNIIFVLNLLIATGMQKLDIYLVPVSLAGLLISIMIDTKLAILINVFSAILISIITRGQVNEAVSFNFLYISLIVGTVGCVFVTKSKHRSTLFGIGVLMGAVEMVLIIVFEYLSTSKMDLTLLGNSMLGLLNGVICITIAIGSLPVWEIIFDVLTPLKLLEISNPNQPLINRMMIEMPGTYHHSLVVGNLSEAAIQEIGGNALLARVGAYYHDIGKLNRPYFFKENQLGDNPHEKLTPNLSTLIITSHVKDGIEIANQYKLPKQIINFIIEHHGDTLVAYFYHKAYQIDPEVTEENFRYPGPTPQTKETAVVMLADSVEAAVRAMPNPTRGKVEGLIRKIIKDKLDDGQLEECPLTLKDLDKIAKVFVKVLSGVFHERIEYPDLSKDKKHEVKSNTEGINALNNKQGENINETDNGKQAEQNSTDK